MAPQRLQKIGSVNSAAFLDTARILVGIVVQRSYRVFYSERRQIGCNAGGEDLVMKTDQILQQIDRDGFAVLPAVFASPEIQTILGSLETAFQTQQDSAIR